MQTTTSNRMALTLNKLFFILFLAAISTTVTDAFYLPDYPRDDSKCLDFATRFRDTTGQYKTTRTLKGGKGAIIQLSLVDHNVVGRLAFNGIFGYLAFGYVGPIPGNPMLGGSVIMATRAGGYTSEKGMDLTQPPVVVELVINATVRDFRYWQTPYVYKRNYKGDFMVNTTADGCFTYLTFDMHFIAGRHFNESGTDKFMWAANDVDSFMSHHGSNVGQFEIDWANYENPPTTSPFFNPTQPPKPTVPPVRPPFFRAPTVPKAPTPPVPAPTAPAPMSNDGFFARLMKGIMSFFRSLWPF